jgi:REP element-mobilizing transposase RayT
MFDSSEVYYVVLRGSSRRPIFSDDEDRDHFTRIVEASVADCGVSVHAFCWTGAEARLAVATSDRPIGQFAEVLVEHHGSRLRLREPTLTGSHLEQQRYRGVLIDGQSALLDLVRHIHLAPVKSGLVREPADYVWSSHRAYLGLESHPWLDVAPVLALFGAQPEAARAAYREFIQRSLEPLESAGRAGPPPAGETRRP